MYFENRRGKHRKQFKTIEDNKKHASTVRGKVYAKYTAYLKNTKTCRHTNTRTHKRHTEFFLHTQFIYCTQFWFSFQNRFWRSRGLVVCNDNDTQRITYRQLILFYSCDFSMHKTSAFRWCRSEWRIHRFARPKVRYLFIYHVSNLFLIALCFSLCIHRKGVSLTKHFKGINWLLYNILEKG